MADIQSNIDLNIDTTQALASIRALQSQISAFHRTLAKGGATANAQSMQMQQNLINTINKTGAFSASMTKVASTTETFTNALEKNKLTMGQTFKYSMASTKTFGKFFRSEFDTVAKTARERVKDLQTQYIRLGRDASGAMNAIQVRPLTLDLKNLGTQTAILAQKQQIFNKLMNQGSTNLLNWGKNTQWAGRQLMVGFTIPLGMMGAAAAKSFMDIEKEIIKIRRVYGDFTTSIAETDKAIDALKGLSNEFTKYGVAVKDTLALAADFAAAGNQGTALLDQVREASRLAVLGNVSQQEAFEATISVTNAFGVAAEDLAGKIDFLNAVENQSVTSIEDLTIAIPKAGPVVKQLGGTVEDLAFFLTAMKEGGINASEGANALKSGLASLINPSEKSSKFLGDLGINIKGIVEGNAGDVRNTVIEFGEALDTLDPLDRARAIEQLFGKFQFSRISTLFQNVIDQGSQANRVLELTKSSSEELAILSERELKRVESSPVFKFQKAMQDFQTALAPVGEQFLKAVTPLIEFGTKLLEQFNGMSDGAKQFTTIAVAAIGGIGPVLLMIIGLIANAGANIMKFVNLVRGKFQNTAGEVGILGNQTEYLTQAQIKSMSAAASLEQAHNTLTQQFTSEVGAIQSLITAYNSAAAAQAKFAAAGAPASAAKQLTITTNSRGGRRVIAPQGYASGVLSVPGPKGAGDVVPAMLSPGEAVIPAKQAKKYAPFIQDMISGNIPGFMRGVFLGMPKSSKSISKNREVGQQIHELFKQSSFAKTPPTEYGHQIAPTTGHSFPIFGLGGVYQKGNKRVFVKPVMDEKAALAEMRATQISREAHGLESPKQRIVVIKDPVDVTGQRKYLALESDLDPKFVNNSPLGVFNEKQYFKQLTASLLRADKDLSASNVYRNVVADVGPAGVFDRASGLRDYAKRLPSMEEQALVNLLGVKGGAKKAFAESTKGLMSNLTPEQYHQKMISEIQETLPKLKNTIASFKLKDPRDIGVYADMVKRLESGLNVDWRKFHTIHSSVKIPKPKVPKEVNSSELLREYEDGTASVAPLSADEKAKSKKINDLEQSYYQESGRSERTAQKAIKALESRFGKGNVAPPPPLVSVEKYTNQALRELAEAGVSKANALKIISSGVDQATSVDQLANFKKSLTAQISGATKNKDGFVKDSKGFASSVRKAIGWTPNNAGARAFGHIFGGANMPVQEILRLHENGTIKLDKNELIALKAIIKDAPTYIDDSGKMRTNTLSVKTALGIDGMSSSLNAKLNAGTATKMQFLEEMEGLGSRKWNRSLDLVNVDTQDPKIQRQISQFDENFKSIAKGLPDDVSIADDEMVAEQRNKNHDEAKAKLAKAQQSGDAKAIKAAEKQLLKNPLTVSASSIYAQARQASVGISPSVIRGLDLAHETATEVRGSGTKQVQEPLRKAGIKNPFVSPGQSRKAISAPGAIPQLSAVAANDRKQFDFLKQFMSRRFPGYKFAKGVVSVPGPKGAGDVVPAMLSPGEAVIPTKMAKKYSPLINAMIAGNIPGYNEGTPKVVEAPTPPGGARKDRKAVSTSTAASSKLAPPKQPVFEIDQKTAKEMGQATGKEIGKSKPFATTLGKRVLDSPIITKTRSEFKSFMNVVSAQPGSSSSNINNPILRSIAQMGQQNSDKISQKVDKQLGITRGPRGGARDVQTNAPLSPKQVQQRQQSAKAEQRSGMGGKMAGGASLAGMGAMMYGQSGGPGAEMAAMASMPLMMAPMLAPVLKMLITPVGLVVAGLLAVVATTAVLKSVFDDAAKASRESTLAMGASTQAIRGFAEFSGGVSAGEIMDERRSGALGQFGVQSGKESFGALFVQSEQAQPLLDSLKKELEGNSGKDLVATVKNQLATAVATGALTRDEAASVAAQLGEEIGDKSFGIKVVGELNDLIGPDGSNILKDPIGIRVKLLQETQGNLEGQIAASGGQVSAGAQMGNLAGVAGAGAVGTVAGIGVGLAAATAAAAKLASVGATVGSVVPGIGTAIGAVVGGAAGLAIGAAVMADNFAKAGAAAGAITAQGIIALQQNQEMLDSLDLEYEKRIASAKAAGDVLEAERLILEQRDGREEIIDVKKQNIDSLVGQYQAANTLFGNPMGEQLDKLIDSMYADNPVMQMATTGARQSIEASAGTAEQEYTLKLLLASGDVDPGAMTNLMGLFGQDQNMIQKIINIQTNLSGADAGRTFALASLFGKDVESQKQFLLNIEGKDNAQAGKLLDMFELVQQSGGILEMDAVLDAYTKDEAAGLKLVEDLDKFREAQAEGPITLDVIQRIFGSQVMAAVAADQKYFNSLDPEQQVTYMTLLETTFKTTEEDPGAYNKWVAAQPAGADVSGQAHAIDTSRSGTRETTKSTSSSDSSEGSGGGGGGGGRQDSTFLDDTVKKIRDFREEGVKLPKTLKQAMDSITKFGQKASAGFDGLSNSIRNAGGGTELVNIALGATEEELAKIFKDGRLTKFGEDLERSLGRVSLGNFVETQRASTAASKKQVSAFEKLRAAGVGVANAQEMIKDQDLVNGLTAAGATAEDTQKAINSWMEAQKEGRKVLSEAERTIEREGLNIAVLSARIGEFQAGLNVLQLQEEDINKKYDKRLEALDDVQRANENIARQQKSQLSLADALSRGDIAAAARAMQQTKEESAQNALQQQRTAIEKAREKELKSLQVSVNGTLLNREEIQTKISDLQKKIADIELKKVKGAERTLVEQDRAAYKEISDSGTPAPAPAPAPASSSGGSGSGGSNTSSTATKAAPTQAEKTEKIASINSDILKYRNELTAKNKQLEIYTTQLNSLKFRQRTTRTEKDRIALQPRIDSTQRSINVINLRREGLQRGIQQRQAELSRLQPKTQYIASGGKVGYYPMGGMIPYKAMGGMFKTINTDSVPAMLSPGEFVIRRSAVERFGEKNLEKINNNMADSSSSVYNYSVNVSVKSDANPDQIAQSVMRQIKQIDSQRIRGNRF